MQQSMVKHHLSLVQRKSSGFTLIEILIVIGIIALLAGIVLVAINPARQFAQARNTQRTAHVNAILNAIGQYTVDNFGDIPEDISNDPMDVSEICEDLVPTYLPTLPVDPAVGDVVIEDCDEAVETDYIVERDDDSGRIRVSAPLAAEEEALGEDAEVISVLR